MPNRVGMFLKTASVLPVDDVVATTDYYRDVFGFDIRSMSGDPPYYAIVERGDASIHFSQREDTSKKIPPCHVYIFVTDVDAVYDEYKARGLDIFTPPEDQDHGMREFEVMDLNGHFMTFGERVRG